MPRTNLDHAWGRSPRLTLRLGRNERLALSELAAEWGTDPSETVRRALREACSAQRLRQREAVELLLPTLTLVRLRELAAQHEIRGRSGMTRDQLRYAIQAAVRASTYPLA